MKTFYRYINCIFSIQAKQRHKSADDFAPAKPLRKSRIHSANGVKEEQEDDDDDDNEEVLPRKSLRIDLERIKVEKKENNEDDEEDEEDEDSDNSEVEVKTNHKRGKLRTRAHQRNESPNRKKR